ncbi:MAG TPA: serine/threonine-protein kinase [Kofleriaceae bacterium]|jgi:serine/threonine protein kinase
MLVRTIGGDDATVTDPSANRATASILLAPGSLLAGRYRVERFLAAGGMGEVHQVLDEILGERVAIKLLREDLSDKSEAQARFTDEIRLARRVTHQNVCRVFDVGTDGPRVFFTMALHQGETLASFLRREGPLEAEAAAPLVAQILDGVGAAHASDVVHADLKPSNIILDKRDGAAPHVLVTDFGLAVSCCSVPGCVCSSAHLVGTPAYMSPEQVKGDPIGRSTDIFSLGIILFEMVTGQLPFTGSTLLELANARLASDAPSPASVRPAVPPRWDSAIRACLANAPAARPSSVADVARALALA